MKNKNLVQVGFCNSPHGIKGEFSFNLFNSENSILKQDLTIYLQIKGSNDFFPYEILKINFGNKVIVKLKGIQSRNEAEALVPFKIYSLKSDWPIVNSNEFYISDLIGLKVRDHLTQLNLGSVVGFYENSVHTILEIKLDNQKLIDVLFIDQFVKDVLIDDGYISILLPEFVE